MPGMTAVVKVSLKLTSPQSQIEIITKNSHSTALSRRKKKIMNRKRNVLLFQGFEISHSFSTPEQMSRFH